MIIEAIVWLTYVVVLVICIEIFGYLWHRYGAHDDYLPGLHDSHRIHHRIDLADHDQADSDFVWVLLLLVGFELMVGFAVMFGLVDIRLAITTVVVSVAVFWWNWWIHNSYHDDESWLNDYAWFQNEKIRHYMHHINPRTNYGIASHFSDRLMNTWIDPVIDSEYKMERS